MFLLRAEHEIGRKIQASRVRGGVPAFAPGALRRGRPAGAKASTYAKASAFAKASSFAKAAADESADKPAGRTADGGFRDVRVRGQPGI
jgi:hypothetical protein